MIIVLKPHTSEENIHRVENLVKKHGLDTHLVQGTGMTIIGCIGDTTLIDPRQFEIDTCVDKVMHVQEPYKLANRAFHPEDSIIDVSGVKIGGEHLGLIAGPCSVESYEQVLEIAQKAKTSGANLLRGGAFKQEQVLTLSRDSDLRDLIFSVQSEKKSDFLLSQNSCLPSIWMYSMRKLT